MKPRTQNFLLLVASTALCSIALELVLRSIEDSRSWARKLRQPGHWIQAPAWIHDPHVSARFNPDWQGTYTFHRDFPPVPIRSNQWGFRFPDYQLEKAPGIRRIALIGDSLTAGLQVSDEQHFRSRSEALLRTDGPTEVLNFGIPGTGPVTHANMYRHYARPFDPDLVLLGIYTPNDFSDDASVPWRTEAGEPIAEPFVDAPGDLRKVLKANSALAVATWELLRRRSPSADRRPEGSKPNESLEVSPDAETPAHELAQISAREYANKLAIWKTVIAEMRGDSVEVWVILFPTGATFREPGEWQASARQVELHRRLATELESAGARVFEGRELLRRHGRRAGSTPWARIGDYLSAEGHLTLAELIREQWPEKRIESAESGAPR